MSELENEQEKPLTDAEFEKKRKALELRRLEADTQDIEERLAEREMKRETKRQRSINNGQTLRQIEASSKAAQEHCNHKKGGSGAQGFIAGEGDDPQYSVLKHRMPNGDVWVRCLRCGKTWKPPVESKFTVNGKFNKQAFDEAVQEYEKAVAFQTRNQMSGSIQFRFGDGGKYFREVTKDVNMR
jgi:TolA-binding protein